MSIRVSNKLLLLEQWSRGVSEITAAEGTKQFIPALLTSVRRIVDFDFIMVFAYRGNGTPLVFGDTLDAPRHRIIASDYAAGPFLLDPFFRKVSEGNQSGCYRLRDIAPDHFRRSEYFREHYSRTGIGEEIGIFFDLGAGLTGVTSFARWDHSPPVVRAELDILKAIETSIAALCARNWSNLHGIGDQLQHFGPMAEQGRFKPLSAREREIVTMILQGHSTASIALHLDISPGTVKIHRKNTYRKLQISTQAELFSIFMGFAPPASFGPAYLPGDMVGAPEIAHVRRRLR